MAVNGTCAAPLIFLAGGLDRKMAVRRRIGQRPMEDVGRAWGCTLGVEFHLPKPGRLHSPLRAAVFRFQ